MHYLCHALNLAGEEAYSHNPNVHPDLRTPALSMDIIRSHQAAGRNPIVIYPEVISGNPMNAKHVVRYLLAPPSAYTDEPIDLQESDLVYTFGPSIVPAGWNASRLRIPLVDTRIFNTHGVDDKARRGSAVFFHRHLNNGGTLVPETANAIEISYRVQERSAEELAALFRSVTCLYIYEHSTVVFEALLCGCPVIFIVNDQSLPDPVPWLVDGHGVSWSLEPDAIAQAKATVKNAPAFFDQEDVVFWEDLNRFIATTQQHALGKQTQPSNTTPTLPAVTSTTHALPGTTTLATRKKRLVVYTVESTWSPCPQIRLLRPFAHLADNWELVWGIVDGQLLLDAGKDADLILLHRFTPGLMPIATLQAIFSLGKPVVYESDDLLNAIPADHPEAATSVSWKEGIEYAVTHAHAVVVSTPYLADKYRPMNSAIHVLKNYLDVDLFYRPVPRKKKSDNITIGLLGSSIQPSNFALVDQALHALCDKYKERLTIHFVGWECPKGWENHPNARFHTFIHAYVDYAVWLKEVAWDIALIPLAQDDYNQCKSSVKWLDYSAAGIASIFSDVSVYSDVVTHNKTGYLLPNQHALWLKQIVALIESPQQRQKIALAAQKEVQADFNLQHHAARYHQIYSSFLQTPANTSLPSPASVPTHAVDASPHNVPEKAATTPRSHRIPGILILDPSAQTAQLKASLDSLALFLPETVKIVVLTTGDSFAHPIGTSLQCVQVKPDAYAGMLGRLKFHVAFDWLAHQQAGHIFTANDVGNLSHYQSEALLQTAPQ